MSLLVCCVLGACAGGAGLPGVVLRAAAVGRQVHGPVATARSWALVLSADLSFRLGGALRVARDGGDTSGVTTEHVRGAQLDCPAARLCAWERAAVASTLGAIGEEEGMLR